MRSIFFKGIRWYKYHNVLLPDVAPHINITLSAQDAKELLRLTDAYFIRSTSDFDSRRNYPFWYIIKDTEEDESLKSYPSKIRSEIRRGLKNNEVYLLENIETSTLLELYRVYRLAFNRYRNVYTNILLSKNLHIWVSKLKNSNRINAFALVKLEYNGKVANYSVIKLHPDYLKFYPAYALIFSMNKFYLNERKFLYVYDGARNLGHETNIQDWLIKKFRFRKAYAKLNVYYRWDIGFIAKCSYYLRGFIQKLENKSAIIKKLSILAKHEEIRRFCSDDK